MPKVLIPLAPGFEEIEAVTIIDLLRRAEVDVTVAGLEEPFIKGSHHVSVKCDMYYKDVTIDDYDYLILPGGQPGTNHLKGNRTIIQWVQTFSKNGKTLGAICAAPIVLHAADVIEGKNITSYPSERSSLKKVKYTEQNVVKDGNVITSRGVGTAIDFALELIQIMKGKKVRDEVADRILYKL